MSDIVEEMGGYMGDGSEFADEAPDLLDEHKASQLASSAALLDKEENEL